MNIKYKIGIVSVVFYIGVVHYVSAQEVPILTATLSSTTPASQSLQVGAQYFEVTKITLAASGGDIFLTGIYLNTDVSGGLSNFTNLFLYNSTPTLLGTYPNPSENPNLIQFSNVIIGNGKSKTYTVKASISDTAAGNVRVGFSGFTFGTLATPTLVGVPIYGNTMTLPGATPTSTPTPTPTLSPSATPTPTPASTPITPAPLGFISLATLGLHEGDTLSVSGSDDPDIYIANEWGYKRLFLNPVIFGFYGHLGGFVKVKTTTSVTRDTMVTSGLFRNCETEDPKVYGVETTGEDTGILHWVNTSGDQAVADDADFFKKVFCINTNEFSWYNQGSEYTSVNQVPSYSR